jgi:Zn-dependent metalloprotease
MDAFCIHRILVHREGKMSVKRAWILVLMVSMVVLTMGVGPRTADTVQALPLAPILDDVHASNSYTDHLVASRVAASPDTAFRWGLAMVDGSSEVGSHTSAVMDPRDGIPFISYHDATNGHLRLANPVAPGSGNCGPDNDWWCRSVDSSGDIGRASSIDIWQGGNVWKLGISYYNATTYSLEYAQYTEGGGSPGWTFTTIAAGSLSATNGTFTSLAFDSTGTPHIGYYHSSGLSKALMYAHYIGGGAGNCTDTDWACDLIDSPTGTGAGAGRFASLALNESDQPRIAYWHTEAHPLGSTLNFAQYLGGGGNCGPGNAWQCDTIDNVATLASESGPLVSLQVRQGLSKETAYIAYYEANNDVLKYASSDAAGSGNCGPDNNWSCVKIDDVGASSEPMGASLAVDGMGPVIAYHDVDDGDVLKVAQPIFRLGLPSGNCGPMQGSYPSWQCSTVDNSYDSDVGSYPAVVLGADHLATIAYHNASADTLLVARETRQALPPTSPDCGGEFFASAAASFYSDDPDQPHGHDSDLQVARTGTYTRTTLLTFDLGDSIPAGTIIQSAELQLRYILDPAPIPYHLETRSVVEPWSEGTVTWNNQPVLGTEFGAKYYGQSYAAGMTITMRVDVDVTTWLAMRATQALSQTSLALLPGDESDMDVRFVAGEGEDLLLGPRLVVRCIPPLVPVPADTSQADQLQLAGLARLQANSTVSPTIRLEAGAVRFAAFDLPIPPGVADDGLTRAEWFTEEYKDLLRLEDPDSQLQLVRCSSDDQDIFFRQRHQGIPVFPAEVGVHLNGEHVTVVSGGYVPHITLDPTPHLSAKEAEALALALAAPQAQVIGDTQLRYVNLGLMGSPDHTTHLAWKVNVDPVESRSLYIDANSGVLLYKENDTEEGWDLELRNGNHFGPAIPDYGCWFWPMTELSTHLCTGGGCVPGACVGECAAAWWNFVYVYTWWRDGPLHLDSYDGGGDLIEAYIHVGFSPPNAHWVGDCEFFEFADGYAIPRDIVGHEWGHAFISHSAHLGNSGQAGALNESFADIYGYMVDPERDWTIGEDLPDGPIRDMSDPSEFDGPAHMDDWVDPWEWPCIGTSDVNIGCAHFNSGIHNRAAYLLMTGDGIAGEPLNADMAAYLFFHVAHRLAGTASPMIDARNHAVQVAQELDAQWPGWTAGHVCVVRNAYAAVGLGEGDQDCDGKEDNVDPDADGDYIPDDQDKCPGVKSTNNSDLDGDGEGDVCDENDDGDAWLDVFDNCPRVYQWDQADWNGDGQGDVCDDSDGDGVLDNTDNCPAVHNADQTNTDSYHDNLGDVCDDDDDNDGVLDSVDKCPLVDSQNQDDDDGDNIGNICDLCPNVASSDNGDCDGDGLGNPCDPDQDNDRICNVGGPLAGGPGLLPGGCQASQWGYDNCPCVKNWNQLDLDQNGTGSACDNESAPFSSWIQQFAESSPVPVYIPDTCDGCGDTYLPHGYETRINVKPGVDCYTHVVDSYGTVVAHGLMSATDPAQQQLDFEPVPYAFSAPMIGQSANVTLAGDLPHDGIHYRLELYPVEGTDLGQAYSITVEFSGGVPTEKIHLPLVLRQAP